MGITANPMGQLKKDFMRIDIENERKKESCEKRS